MTRNETHYSICPLCEATCGLELQVREGEVRRVAGDPEDVFSGGFICPKGAAIGQLHTDPDRLRAPLIREPGGEFQEVSWERAFEYVEERLLSTRGDDRNAAAIYLGNPNVHSVAGLMLAKSLVKALGTINQFTAATVDQMPKHVASGLLYGDPHAIAVPDLDRTDYLLLLGANPWESNGSMCTAPDFPGRVRKLLARGGRFVVIDPRRTRTAEHASEHIPVRPGTDAHLLMGLIHVITRDGLVAPGHLAGHIEGLEALTELATPFTPAAVSQITAIAAETIERLARELAEAKRAVVYGRIGTHTVSFGTLAAWAVDALNVITGNLDTPGGAMWALPGHLSPYRQNTRRPFALGRWKSRARGLPEAMGELPAATLVDELETQGPGQVRVLITVAGNPVLSLPDGDRLDRALSQIPFMVSVDPYLNETTRHAHVILPPPSALTRSHYDVALSRLAVLNHARWSPPVFAPRGPTEAEIAARLTLIAAGQPASSEPRAVFMQIEHHLADAAIRDNPRLEGRKATELLGMLEARDPVDRFVEIMVRGGAYGDAFGEVPDGLTFESLRSHPHGIDLGPLKPELPGVLQTASGRIELMPAPIREDLGRLTEALHSDVKGTGFTLIGRRDLRSNNSWMHNLPKLVKGKARCTLLIHPEDAAGLNVESGGLVRVQTSKGEVVAPAELTDTIMPGVVSLPHGFGHDKPGTTQRVAAEHAGVNVNLLTGSEELDRLSGNAVLTGVRVELSPA